MDSTKRIIFFKIIDNMSILVYDLLEEPLFSYKDSLDVKTFRTFCYFTNLFLSRPACTVKKEKARPRRIHA